MPSPRPSYLLTGISPELRLLLVREAEAMDSSLAHIVRVALSEHLGLEAPRKSRRYTAHLDRGTSRMVIRTSPELFAAVKEEAQQSHRTMKQTIIDILNDRLGTQTGREDG